MLHFSCAILPTITDDPLDHVFNEITKTHNTALSTVLPAFYNDISHI